MMAPIISDLRALDIDSYDYLIAGGGTSGCIVASRLAESLPNKRVLLIEAGPSDYQDERVADLKNWIDLLGTELDYDYGIAEQPRGEPTVYTHPEDSSILIVFRAIGNSALRQSRAKVLGGCSSHNGGVSLHTWEDDCKRFQQLGCTRWDFESIRRAIRNTPFRWNIVDSSRQNALVTDWIKACSTAFNVPILPNINQHIANNRNIVGGTGYMPIAYDKPDGTRVSTSTSHIHPLLRNDHQLPNLTILTNTWVSRINLTDRKVIGLTLDQNGREAQIKHRVETILCAGAIDTPRLMLLSGIGPKDQLDRLSIPVQQDVPGVGENLSDHVEANLIWELKRPAPPQTATYSDSFFFYKGMEGFADVGEGEVADIMFHLYTTPQLPNFDHIGYTPPRYPLVIMPNVPRPRSRGRLYLSSADPKVQPVIDFSYFTDKEGYDEAVIIEGIKLARKLARTSPLKEWILREAAPGPHITSDEALSKFGRKNSTTLFHPCGTTKMGDISKDALAVVDSEYRVRELKGLRIVDAGVLPTITTTNPMLTIIAIAEIAAELIANSALDTGEGAVSKL